MATYVLVPGGGWGGFVWRPVMSLLRAAGHEVFMPTLTGLGEGVHLASPAFDLATHVQDIVGVLEYEDLTGVILVGHSYAGMVITGVAERVPHRLAHLVYVDAVVPRDGEADVDLLGPEFVQEMADLAHAHGDGWGLSPGPGAPPDRETAHLWKPMLQPLTVANPVAEGLVPAHSQAELGYWLGVPYWNQGYITEAVRRVTAFAFAERAVHRVQAGCFPRNGASARVMEKAGMQYEGVLRGYVRKGEIFEDVAMYAVVRSQEAHGSPN